jgi:hypothetical protein
LTATRGNPDGRLQNVLDVVASMSKKPHFSSDGKSAKNYTTGNCNGQAGFFSHICVGEPNPLPERIYRLRSVAEPLFKDQREFDEWRRRDNHKRWIRSFILADLAHTVEVRITFARFITLAQVRHVTRRVVRWLRRLIGSWVKILERGRGGIHAHLIVRLACGVQAQTGIEQIEAMIARSKRPRDHLGRCQAKGVRSAAATARYLTKTLAREQAHNRVAGYCITYSGDIVRKPWWLEEEHKFYENTKTTNP